MSYIDWQSHCQFLTKSHQSWHLGGRNSGVFTTRLNDLGWIEVRSICLCYEIRNFTLVLCETFMNCQLYVRRNLKKSFYTARVVLRSKDEDVINWINFKILLGVQTGLHLYDRNSCLNMPNFVLVSEVLKGLLMTPSM